MDTSTEEKKDAARDTARKHDGGLWNALGLAWELGYLIAIPIVVFGLIGRFADRRLHTYPWIFLAGIVVALAITAFAVYRKTRAILSDDNRV